jgi:phosphoribosylaminoimidazolecarboxamide formyltransferase / IMP cyclohydrolase
MAKDLKKMYRTILGDHFPARMEIAFIEGRQRQTLVYEKVGWTIGNETRGLRYGENPTQEAAMYRLVNGNLVLGDVTMIKPGRWLASDAELIQSGKHPGKINLTDADGALNILRYLSDRPTAVIVKHNNPCGVAQGKTLREAYVKADLADRIAAYGGAIGFNRALDLATAKEIVLRYAEVVAAPEFERGVIDVLAKKPALRIMRIKNMDRLEQFVDAPFIEFKSLIDGGQIAQWSFTPKCRSARDLLPAECEYQGKTYQVKRKPTKKELDDMVFGWMVEAGVTSNSVLYVKDRVTVGIGTGEQDRVGVAEIARDKAYRKFADRLCFEATGKPLATLARAKDRAHYAKLAAQQHGGLQGSVMVSDAFFPFRDGIEVGLKEGVTAVIQPGGSERDYESIEAANDFGAAMMYTGERSFKH